MTKTTSERLTNATIQIRGLVGFVPITIAGKRSGFLGLLPDVGNNYQLKPVQAISVGIQNHVGALLIRASDYDKSSSTRRPDLRFRVDESDDEVMLFLLKTEKLKIINLLGNRLASTLTEIGQNNMGNMANETNQSQLQWIHSVDQANRNLGGFNKDKYLDNNQIPKDIDSFPKLAASVHFNSGRLEVGEVTQNLVQFKVPTRTDVDWEQSLQKTIKWNVQTNDSFIEFEFSNNSASNTVRLNIGPDTPIEIVNYELQSILGIAHPPTEPYPLVDYDTGVFYNMTMNPPPPSLGMPLPHIQRASTTPATQASDPLCNAARFRDRIEFP